MIISIPKNIDTLDNQTEEPASSAGEKIDWDELRADILSRIDFVDECKRIGVRFVQDHPNTNGWIPCYAVDREDQNASAAIQSANGYYKDSGGKQFDFFTLLNVMHECSDYSSAIRYYAEKFGLPVPKGKIVRSSERKPENGIEIQSWNGNGDRFCVIKHTTREAIERAGGGVCRHAGKYVCIYLPVYSADLDVIADAPPLGYKVMQTNGQGFPVYQNGAVIDTIKAKNVSGTKCGLIGYEGLNLIRKARAEGRLQDITVIKTEGETDLLTLMSQIPEADRDKYAVVTNYAGTSETPKAEWSEVFRGCNVVVIHDCDTPGRTGAKKFCDWLAGSAKSIKNVVLPYDITDNHGKDLRDYLTDGSGNFGGLIELIDATAEYTKDANAGVEEFDDSPHRIAGKFIDSRYTMGDNRTIVFIHNQLLYWTEGRYEEIKESEIASELTTFCHRLFKEDCQREFVEWKQNPEGKPPKIKRVTKRLIADTIAALKGLVVHPCGESTDCSFWLADPPEGFDDIRWLIPTRDYIINARRYAEWLSSEDDSIEYRIPSTPEFFTRSAINCEFDPGADCVEFKTVLWDLMEHDEEKYYVVMEMIGLCLVSYQGYQKFFILEGDGRNGKSTVLAAIHALLGLRNVSAVQLELFGDRFALDQTRGKLANIVDDMTDTDKVCEGRLKNYVSGSPIGTDRKNQAGLSFVPTATLIFACNQLPRFTDKMNGIWRRLILIPFRYVIPEDKIVQQYASFDYWNKFQSGLLNFALEGLARLIANGKFSISANMDAVNNEYKTIANPILEFFDEYLTPMDGASTDCKILYESYCRWCTDSNLKPLSKPNFGREVSRKFNVIRERSMNEYSRRYVYRGIYYNDN